MTAMSDLPLDLVEEILSRVPITSLRAVRSTCKRWNDSSKDPNLTKKYYGKEAKEAMAVMICHSKACLMSVNLHNHKDLVDSSIKQIGKLNQVTISEVYHCDGLLLCVTEKDLIRLMVWNPYLGQIRWIQRPRNEFLLMIDKFAIGYDNNNNHKILKLHSPWMNYKAYKVGENGYYKKWILEKTKVGNLRSKFGANLQYLQEAKDDKKKVMIY